jgi:hypothetical protein
MGMSPDRDRRRYRAGRADGRGCMDVQVRGRVIGVEGVHTFGGREEFGRRRGIYRGWAECMIKWNTMTMSFYTVV